MKFELKESMAKLEEVNTALEAREKILREDSVKVEFMQ